VKSGDTWIKSIPLHGGCAKYFWNHILGRGSSQNRENAPYTGHGLLQIAEGHAWRQSLCRGKEEAGYTWLGRNLEETKRPGRNVE